MLQTESALQVVVSSWPRPRDVLALLPEWPQEPLETGLHPRPSLATDTNPRPVCKGQGQGLTLEPKSQHPGLTGSGRGAGWESRPGEAPLAGPGHPGQRSLRVWLLVLHTTPSEWWCWPQQSLSVLSPCPPARWHTAHCREKPSRDLF